MYRFVVQNMFVYEQVIVVFKIMVSVDGKWQVVVQLQIGMCLILDLVCCF